MTKTLLSLTGVLFSITSGALAVEAGGPAEFTSALRSAITEKDAQKLENLTFLEGASPADRQQVAGMWRMLFLNGKEVTDIRLEPLAEDFQGVHIVRGKKIEPTAMPQGMVSVAFKSGELGQGNASASYAIVDGRHLLVGMKSTDLGWNGPPDKNIGFTVVGGGASDLQMHGVWNASGVRLQKTFKETGLTMWGQHFEEFTLTSDTDACDVTLAILEDGKTIFSKQLTGRGVLHYLREAAEPAQTGGEKPSN